MTTKVRDVDAVSKMLQAGFGADRCHGLCVAHNAGCGEKGNIVSGSSEGWADG